jgi:hypothetical protein
MKRTSAFHTALAAVVFVLVAAIPTSAANIIVVSYDPPGTGFYDATPAAPVGGNPGTTLGVQRQYVYQYAAELWGARLVSDSTIYVHASFRPLSCAPTAGTLGSAGTPYVFANFSGALETNTWYHSALADSLAHIDLNPGFFDIVSNFNSDIDDPAADSACLTGRNWYYGIDHNHGGDFDFLAVVAHELAHGLGFANFVNEATGTLLAGRSDVFANRTFDVTAGQTWGQMATNAERAASAVNDRKVVWNGGMVTAQASTVLGPRPSMKILTPGSLEGSVEVQSASFGAPLTSPGTTGKVVLAVDGVGDANDACSPLSRKADGKIVLAYRGTCAFTVKAANAQAAGAVGIIVANNSPAGLPPMGGADPAVSIPAVGISQADGDAIRAAIFPTVNVRIGLDFDFSAGTEMGFVRLYAPTTVSLGSSGSHFDVTATPNLLMEPFISTDLRPSETLDLTPALFQDIGWTVLP